MLSGHSFAAQEIKHLWKFTRGFIGPQNLNFERSNSLFPGPQSRLIPPCKISVRGPDAKLKMDIKGEQNDVWFKRYGIRSPLEDATGVMNRTADTQAFIANSFIICFLS